MAINMSPLMFMQIALENPALAAQYMAAQGKTPPPLGAGTGVPGSDPSQNPVQDVASSPGPVQLPPENFAQSLVPELALPGMGDVPTVPEAPLPEGRKKGADNSEGSKRGQATSIPAQAAVQSTPPFDMRANIPQWNAGMPSAPDGATVTTAAPPQLSPLPAPTAIAALPVPPAAATAPVPAAASPGGPPTTPAAGPASPMDAFAQSLLGLATPSGAGGGVGRVGQAPAPYIQGALAPGTAAILQQILASAAQGPGQLNIRG